MGAVPQRGSLASDVLSGEHRIVETALTALEHYCKAVARGVAVPAGMVPRFLAFFRGFADKAHHAKEEELLFARYEERGMPRDEGPVAVMLYEHDEMRGMLSALDAAEREGARNEVVARGREYVATLRQHIAKEDSVLYPMGNRVLTADDQIELLEAFAAVDRDTIGLAQVAEHRDEAVRLLDQCSEL